MKRPFATLGVAGLLLFAAVAQAGPGAPFLWVVEGQKVRHYLLGSLHLLPADAHPLPAPIEAAYDSARTLVFESDLTALATPDAQASVLMAARETDEGGLKARIGPRLYQRLEKRAEALGLPMEIFDGFKPWFCAVTLEVLNFQQAGYSPELGLDQHFLAKARADQKALRWFEPPEQHLRLLSDMPDEVSTDFLAATLDELTDSAQAPAELLRSWKEGDEAAIEKMLREMKARYPRAYARLFADRNRAWLPVLGDMLKGEVPTLVIVGAAHWVGPDGLLEALRDRGFKLRSATAAEAAVEVTLRARPVPAPPPPALRQPIP